MNQKTYFLKREKSSLKIKEEIDGVKMVEDSLQALKDGKVYEF